MSTQRIAILTLLSMLAFAGNSLLCRAALRVTATEAASIDAVSFTTIRLLAGAIALLLIVRLRLRGPEPVPALRGTSPATATATARAVDGNWLSALALFTYAICFSYAYAQLSAAVGALLLFGAVQATMIGVGLARGERLKSLQLLGIAVALTGLVALLVPDPLALVAPPLLGVVLMLTSGVAWGVYSLRGKSAADATQVTAGNFARAVPFALGFGAISLLLPLVAPALVLNIAPNVAPNIAPYGVLYAVMSGVITSGMGYAIWYTALPALKATTAATVQLSVPVIATLGGVVFLGEAVSLRIILASIAILGGIALVIFKK